MNRLETNATHWATKRQSPKHRNNKRLSMVHARVVRGRSIPDDEVCQPASRMLADKQNTTCCDALRRRDGHLKQRNSRVGDGGGVGQGRFTPDASVCEPTSTMLARLVLCGCAELAPAGSTAAIKQVFLDETEITWVGANDDCGRWVKRLLPKAREYVPIACYTCW